MTEPTEGKKASPELAGGIRVVSVEKQFIKRKSLD